MKIPKIIQKYLWKNFGAVKISCTALCFVLIFDLFIKYFVEKPTLTSSTRTDITSQNFPVVTVCHHEQIDKSSLEAIGFKNSFYYRTGGGDPSYNNGTHHKISWNGNSSESVYEVSDKITLLKSVTDCPKNSSFLYSKKLKDLEGNLVGRKPLKFNLTVALYPNHKCCKAKLPNLEDVDIIKAIRIADTSQNLNKNFRSFRLYLSDQISDSPFTLAKNFNLGDKITITNDKTSLHKRYKVKVSQENHVEGDPKYPCINYVKHGEYGECLEKEMIKSVQKQLNFNCTPPWLTENEVDNT